MEELNLSDLLLFYRRKIYLVLIAIILGVIFGSCYTYILKTPMYSSTVTYLLSATSEEGQGINVSNLTLNEKLVPTYRELVKSRLVLSDVITNLHLSDIGVSSLAGMVSLDQVGDSSMIRITVNNKDPEVAQKLASAIGEGFEKEVYNRYQISNIEIVDVPVKATQPYNSSYLKDILMVTALCVMAIMAFIFAQYMLDTTVKYSSNLEEVLEMPILGCVRNVELKKGKK